MSCPKQSRKSPTVQGDLNGKPTDQISPETNVSKGRVHYLINDRKKEFGMPDIDDLRKFSVTARKTRISIGQCTQGFGMIRIMKNPGIHEGDDDDNGLMMNIT